MPRLVLQSLLGSCESAWSSDIKKLLLLHKNYHYTKISKSENRGWVARNLNTASKLRNVFCSTKNPLLVPVPSLNQESRNYHCRIHTPRELPLHTELSRWINRTYLLRTNIAASQYILLKSGPPTVQFSLHSITPPKSRIKILPLQNAYFTRTIATNKNLNIWRK